ncbi:hypothetical protein GDO86_012929, partial [Hymenochirus boettgeri]
MAWKGFLYCSYLVLLTLQFIDSNTAFPLLEPEDRELDAFKSVLERLGEKLSVLEALDTRTSQEAEDPAAEGDVTQAESRLVIEQQSPARDSFLKGLRSLHSPKMMRGSGCFGRRIDRIDSLSGMGCNGKS